MRFRSFSRKRNINTLVTVTVTEYGTCGEESELLCFELEATFCRRIHICSSCWAHRTWSWIKRSASISVSYKQRTLFIPGANFTCSQINKQVNNGIAKWLNCWTNPVDAGLLSTCRITVDVQNGIREKYTCISERFISVCFKLNKAITYVIPLLQLLSDHQLTPSLFHS